MLNAKHHAQEAEIISQAGQKGAVTIATNMAGRGTDIVLGEEVPGWVDCISWAPSATKAAASITNSEAVPAVRAIKGLHGFICLWKMILLRIFGSDRISGFMAKLGMENGQPIEHPMVSKAVENAQRKVEAHHFDIRKHVLEYDDVMNRQREVIYALRRDILTGENQKDILYDMADEVLEETLADIIPKDIYPEEWDIDMLNENLKRLFDVSIKKMDDQTLQLNGQKEIKLEDCKAEELHEEIFQAATVKYDLKEKEVGSELLRYPRTDGSCYRCWTTCGANIYWRWII